MTHPSQTTASTTTASFCGVVWAPPSEMPETSTRTAVAMTRAVTAATISDGQPGHRRPETEERPTRRDEQCQRDAARPGLPIAGQHGGGDGDPAGAEQDDREREECARSVALTQPPVDGEYAQECAGTPQSPRQHKGRSAQGTAQYQPESANCSDFTVL